MPHLLAEAHSTGSRDPAGSSAATDSAGRSTFRTPSELSTWASPIAFSGVVPESCTPSRVEGVRVERECSGGIDDKRARATEAADHPVAHADEPTSDIRKSLDGLTKRLSRRNLSELRENTGRAVHPGVAVAAVRTAAHEQRDAKADDAGEYAVCTSSSRHVCDHKLSAFIQQKDDRDAVLDVSPAQQTRKVAAALTTLCSHQYPEISHRRCSA